MEHSARLEDAWRWCVNEPSNPNAWEALLIAHGRILRAIAARIAAQWGVANPDEIDDAFQEICCKLSTFATSRSLPACEGDALERYLKAVAANAARDYFRARYGTHGQKQPTSCIYDHQAELQSSVNAEAIEASLLIKQLENFLADDERSRTIFLLYYRQGFTAKEIAAIPAFGLTVKGVESLLGRAVLRIKEKFRPRAEGLSPEDPS